MLYKAICSEDGGRVHSEFRALLILGALSLLVAFVGCTAEVDPISLWILDFVKDMDSFAWLRPYRLPEPANNEYGFRPMSVLLLRSYVQLFGSGIPPMGVVFVKAFVSALALCCCFLALAEIERDAENRLSCGMSRDIFKPTFGLWCLAELDGLGAAGILGVSILLAKQDKMWLEHLSIGKAYCFFRFAQGVCRFDSVCRDGC